MASDALAVELLVLGLGLLQLDLRLSGGGLLTSKEHLGGHVEVVLAIVSLLDVSALHDGQVEWPLRR